MGRGVAALGRGSEADGGSNFQHERGRSPAESGSENGRAQQSRRGKGCCHARPTSGGAGFESLEWPGWPRLVLSLFSLLSFF